MKALWQAVLFLLGILCLKASFPRSKVPTKTKNKPNQNQKRKPIIIATEDNDEQQSSSILMFLKSRRNQENNNSNSNNSQYGGGLVPEENEDEIDCSMFIDLDELPPFCQENQTATDQGSSATGDTGPDSQAPPPPQGGSASTTVTEGGTMFTDSTIQLPLSLGIYLFENMTEQRSGELMSFVVQVTSTLLDRYTPFDVFAPSPDDSLLLVEMEGGEGKYDDNDADENYEESGSKLLATLYFSSVAASDSPLWDSWLHVSIDYTAVWPNGGSVVQQSELDQIEEASRQVLNMTVDALKFWDELLEQDQYEEYVVRLGETWNQSDTAAIAAVAKFGEEYDLNIAMAGTTAIDSRTGAKPSAPLEPLSVDWSFREWFGLGLCLSTILMATLLSVLSSHLQHRQAAKRLWGFTEEGVGELLKVGWTYHQEGNGQLFLKVFDKGKFGYSDENSILDGNIIDDAGREVSATSATTATPAS